MVSITKPTVGGDSDAWGPKVNTALDALTLAVNNSSQLKCPPPVVGRYYDAANNAYSFTTNGLFANVIYYMPFWQGDGTGRYDRISVAVSTASSSGTAQIRLGVYNDAGGTPGTLVLDAGNVSTATAASVEATVALQLTNQSWYWLALWSGGNATLRCIPVNASPSLGFANNTATGPNTLSQTTSTFGTAFSTTAVGGQSQQPSAPYAIRLRAAA